jgi:predicted  nucleic acid-binding Zn-ribbon protein
MLQADHARMAAASEAVALDRETNAREMAQLENTISSLSTRNAMLSNAVNSAESASRASRDEASKARGDADALRAEIAALQDSVRSGRAIRKLSAAC